MAKTPVSTRILDKKALKEKVPFSPQHIQRLENEDLFPDRIQFGVSRVGWAEFEVDQWIADRMEERNLELPLHSIGKWSKPGYRVLI